MSTLTKSASCAEDRHFIVGRDSADHWVVLETHGLSGGLFADRASALRFARDEAQGHPFAVEIADQRLDFRVTRG